MIDNALLTAAIALALTTVVFAMKSWRDTRKRHFDDYVKRKRNNA
jgi:hypothetical protein